MPSFRVPRRPEERQRILLARQRLKMASSAHAYVRGSTSKFYEWLRETSSTSTRPEGPPVWICGDCHIGNLGPVAHADGRIALQIRDLDQTVIGNPAHDLIRLGLSLAMAARGADLPGVTTAMMIEQMVAGYEAALSYRQRGKHAREERPTPIRFVMKQAVKRSWKHLLEERLADTRPSIPLGTRFWPLRRDEHRAVRELFASEGIQTLITSLHHREHGARMEVVDAAFWMKGCSSLGGLRVAVLVRVEGSSLERGALSLVDVKEAVQAQAPRYSHSSMPKSNGERVVLGARHLSPFLGERMMAARLLDRSVFVRELLPQDLKLELDELSRREAIEVARFLASVVGRAHGRQLERSDRRAWKAELGRRRPKSIEAPTWLWSSVVELVASHEAAYLNHCRKYALEGAR